MSTSDSATIVILLLCGVIASAIAVTTVRHRDPLWYSILWGVVAGAAFGFAAATGLTSLTDVGALAHIWPW